MNVIEPQRRDEGTAYEVRQPAYKRELVAVDRGTPMGELLRRYWHPVGLASHATATPRPVKALGEDLILFRDGAGNAGLVHARCCHRGTTLYYGKVEERGIRCCYHGWLFDTQGRCLEQPCEPEGGLFREKVRQPWYPVEERYGLVFAYMGPPDRKPVLPAYECLEVMDEGEFVEADDSSLGGGGPAIIPCNWLQHYENVVDPFHVPVLHASFSGAQFTLAMASMPKVEFSMSARGVTVRSTRKTDDGKTFYRVTEAAIPTLRVVPNPRVAQYRTRGIDRLGAADRRHVVSHLRRGPRQTSGRSRPHALDVQRKILVGHDRGGAPAPPRRLRGAGRPGGDHRPFGGALRAERPRHCHDPAHARRPARCARGGARTYRREF